MNDEFPGVNPAVWVIYIIIATLFVFLFGVKDDKYTPVVQTFILTLTLFAIVWYTFETSRMHKAVKRQAEAAVNQTNVGILPVFIAYIGRVQMEDERHRFIDCLELENIGNGVALNVSIDELRVELEYEEAGDIFPDTTLIFDAAVSIRPEQKEVFTHKSNTSRPEMQEVADAGLVDWISRLKPERAVKDYELTIRFMDILGNRYVQVIHVGKSGCWPDIVTFDYSNRSPLSITLVTPFSTGVMRAITAKERRELWKSRIRKRRPSS